MGILLGRFSVEDNWVDWTQNTGQVSFEQLGGLKDVE